MAVRERRDVTQGEIAAAIGITTANYSRWESGHRAPREDALAKLAAYLGVTPAFLRYGIGMPLAVADEFADPTIGAVPLTEGQKQRALAAAAKKHAPPAAKSGNGGGRRKR